MELFGDGWYAEREDADAALDGCTAQGALPVGIVENSEGTFGILYWSERELYSNHSFNRPTGRHAFKAERLRPTTERVEALRAWRDGGEWPGPDRR